MIDNLTSGIRRIALFVQERYTYLSEGKEETQAAGGIEGTVDVVLDFRPASATNHLGTLHTVVDLFTRYCAIRGVVKSTALQRILDVKPGLVFRGIPSLQFGRKEPLFF